MLYRRQDASRPTLRRLLISIVSALTFALLLSSVALAVQPGEMLPDPALEARARGLSQQLRCMVCQNQSIDDSDATLARDLRVLVRERLTAGDSDPQVIDYLVSRYGEFVLLKPRFSWRTALLWIAPAAILLAGTFGVYFALRRRRGLAAAGPAAPPLTAEEQRKLAELTRPDGA